MAIGTRLLGLKWPTALCMILYLFTSYSILLERENVVILSLFCKLNFTRLTNIKDYIATLRRLQMSDILLKGIIFANIYILI